MKIHEFQAKAILSAYGVPVPKGEVVATPVEARRAAERLGGAVVLKAQIHAGGRGKAGGVMSASSSQEAEGLANRLIGARLVTHQTGPEGKIVKRILVEEQLVVSRELYAGVVLNYQAARPVIMVSAAGGMEIEAAATDPERITGVAIDPAIQLQPFHIRRLVSGFALPPSIQKAAGGVVSALYQVFQEKDCSLVEINPLVVTTEGRLLALDAKLNIDDNALFRHPELAALRDPDEELPLEVEASKSGLNYIKLNGTVGCMVNGAGLAMATMDLVKLVGGEPANFLDVGGGASAEQIERAFRILVSDQSVKVVFINIFGGILRCDRLAEGVIRAARSLHVTWPIVLRMEGTNVDQGKRMLAESGLNFITADGMQEAAEQAVKAARQAVS
ncbi:malate--CoA ligase subunit beta [Candidatus Methylomirabilis lanthanidiphila]|uniref:Succinate--CoA ligase [ADP-forming] subunit beta n=1 Tax=Candidatus Methylomirabilis lanthanidiphila TaxID=2211376 RepID=A0A564ZI56_9BACT|nr:ADP-forming succinate--CoA ligase subunit beta [Candidatus Methylomirabilis lanthanidiphila]VUZ84332.1 malate--CoA ligase subunit beta [Candidatus Methylomirabilis lanthanidiphila]